MSDTEIVNQSQPDPSSGRTATEIGPDAARAAWAEAARDVLAETARSYNSVVTYQELATQVQERSEVSTTQRSQHWIGRVLGLVTEDCAARHEPLLSALCVNTSGSVGDGYAAAVQAHTGETPTDPDAHAARQRLACYQQAGAGDLPADGGTPTLTAKLRASRTRSRKAEREARPIATCPTCHMALPATGECDNCA